MLLSKSFERNSSLTEPNTTFRKRPTINSVKFTHNFGLNITSNLKLISPYYRMTLVPIKLIKDIPTRNKLLKIKEETPEIDKNDYIESRTSARVDPSAPSLD